MSVEKGVLAIHYIEYRELFNPIFLLSSIIVYCSLFIIYLQYLYIVFCSILFAIFSVCTYKIGRKFCVLRYGC